MLFIELKVGVTFEHLLLTYVPYSNAPLEMSNALAKSEHLSYKNII